MNRLRKNGPTLHLLQKIPAPLQKRILDKPSSELIRCLCDYAYNVLQGNVNISRHHKQIFKQHETKLRKLADRKAVLKTKQRIIQKGGFLPILLSALAPVISGVLGSLIK